jgi:hypothetical protein
MERLRDKICALLLALAIFVASKELKPILQKLILEGEIPE